MTNDKSAVESAQLSAHRAERSLADAAAMLASRRRLLRGGLAAAPVMMTLVSRPVRAGGGTKCTAASAFASVNLSRPDLMSNCSGRVPPYWSGTTSWPSGCKANGSNATQFTAIFPTGNVYAGQTLMQVLNNGSSVGQSGVARYLVAAYLNAGNGWTPNNVLSQSTAKSIWSSFVSNGYYTPTAGVKWNSDQIIAWLGSTMS
jgi:hypothetical protein